MSGLKEVPELQEQGEAMMGKILAITGDIHTFMRLSQQIMKNPFG